MKRKIALILLALALIISLTSCNYTKKLLSQEMSYSDPQTIGGKWTLYFDNGKVYYGAVCSYWGTTDDTSVWTLSDGSKLIQSGVCHAVQEL